MKLDKGLIARRVGSAFIDWSIEFGGGLLGSYFGALLAALLVAMKNGPAEQMQSSIWSGFGFGFVFWTLSISFLNRVLIQGLSRSSIGKKVFKLELISTAHSLTWTTVMTRWVLSFASFVVAGAGYIYVFFNKEGRSFHDVAAHTDIVPVYEGKTMSVEYREETMSMAQIRQLMVISNSQAERPMAMIIRLPVRETVSSHIKLTGTDSFRPGHVAQVIELKSPSSPEEDETKKVA